MARKRFFWEAEEEPIPPQEQPERYPFLKEFDQFKGEEPLGKWLRQSIDPWEGMKIPATTKEGEKLELTLMPDLKVWLEGTEVGKVDPKTGEYRQKELSTWEKAAGVVLPPVLKAVEPISKAFETARDYFFKPAAIALTSQYWGGEALQKPALTKEEMERMSWYEEMATIGKKFLPEGEYTKLYEEMEAPWGVRGAIEFGFELPFWMALPSAAVAKGGIYKLPWIGKYLSKVLTPAVLAEKLPGQAISLATRQVLKIPPVRARAIRKALPKKLGEARARKVAYEELFKLRESEGLLGREIREQPFERISDAYVIKGRVLDQGEGLKWVSMAEAASIGSPFKTKEGLVVFNKHIQPAVKDASRDIHDIIEHTAQYKLSSQGRHFISSLKKSIRDMERLADLEGIVYEKTIEDWFPRHVLEKAGVELSRPSGFWTGLGALDKRKRYWQWAIEGQEQAGLKYIDDPIVELSLAWDGLLRRIAVKRATDALKPLMKPSRAEAIQARALCNVVERLAEGKSVPPVVLRAQEKRFPEFFRRIRAATSEEEAWLGGAPTLAEIDAIRAQIAGLEEYLAFEPARALIDLVKKTGWMKGEISNLTLKQYRTLTGRTTIRQSILTPDRKHVRWEYAFDDAATEYGYPSGDALKEGIERIATNNRELAYLKEQLALFSTPMKPQKIRDAEAFEAILKDAQALWTEKGAIYGAGIALREQAARELIQSRRTVRNLQKAIAGQDITESIGYDLAKELSAEQNAILTKVQQALIAKRAPSRALLNEQLQKALADLAKVEAKVARTKMTAQTMMDVAARELGEAPVAMTGFGNKVFRNISTFDSKGREVIISGQEIAHRVMAKFGERVAAPLRWAANASSVLRLTKAALDDSAMVIQLLGHAVRHPKAWAEAYGGSFITFVADRRFAEKLLRRPENYRAVLELLNSRGIITVSEYTEAAGLLSRGASKAPMIGKHLKMIMEQSFGRFNDAFTGARTIAVINLMKGMSPWAKATGHMDDLGLFLNRSTGFFSMRGMGISAQKRAALNAFGFFAPRFTFAIGNFLADLPRALLYQVPKALWKMGSKDIATREVGGKLMSEAGIRAWWALEHLGALYVGGTALYVSACLAAGIEPKLDLRPKSAGGDGADAYTIQVGGHKIRMVGGMFNLVRSIIAIGCSATEGDAIGVIQDVTRMYRSRTSPFTSFFWDVAAGRDFIGEATRESIEGFGKYTGMQFVPIWVEGVMDAVNKGEKPGALAVIAVVEFFGGSTFPEPEWDKVKAMRQDFITQLLAGELKLEEPFPTEYQRVLIQQKEGLEWKELNRAQKDEIRRLHPKLAKRENTAWEDSLERWGSDTERVIKEGYDEVIGERDEGMEGIAEAFITGQITPRGYNNHRGHIRPHYSGGMAVLYRFQEEMGLTDEETKAKAREKWTFEDKCLSIYKETKGQPITDEYGMPDWTSTNARLEAFLAGLPEATRQYVIEHQNDWINDLPPLARMVEKEREADLAFINGVRIRIPDVGDVSYWDVPKEFADLKLKAREQSPELDAALNFWGYTSVCRSKKARELLQAKADKMGRPYHSIEALTKTEEVSKARKGFFWEGAKTTRKKFFWE